MTTLAWPTLTRAAPQDIDWRLLSNTQKFESPLNRSVQTVELPGARWAASFSFEALEIDDARALYAVLVRLRGMANRVMLPVFHAYAPRGTWAGTPRVNNSSVSPTTLQTGNTLICDGFTAGATVKAGDYFNVGTDGELKMVVVDGTADGSGNLTLTFEPPLRQSPPDNETLVSSNPVCQMMLSEDTARWISHAGNPGALANFPLDFIEVFML